MRAVDEKLVFNKCWPNGDNGQEGECYNGMWVGDEKLMYDKINSGLMLAQMFPDLPHACSFCDKKLERRLHGNGTRVIRQAGLANFFCSI